MAQKVLVWKISTYRDGGTQHFIDNNDPSKEYYKDGRIGSNTRGKIFDHYPGQEVSKELDVELVVTEDRSQKW